MGETVKLTGKSPAPNESALTATEKSSPAIRTSVPGVAELCIHLAYNAEMNWIIRPSQPEDLDGVIRVQNECAPMHKVSRQEVLRDEETLAPELQRIIFVAQAADEIVGVAVANRTAGSYHPMKYMLEMGVSKDFRKQGIGSSLYQTVFDHLADLGLLSISCQVSEANEAGLEFAARRGYAEQKRNFISALDLSTFSPSNFDQPIDGLEIKSLEQLDSPEVREQWFDFFTIVRQDVPRTAPPTPLTFDFFETQIVQEPDLVRSATLFAFKDGQIVGFTAGFHDHENDHFDQWLTATHRNYRGKGIALALKIAQATEIKRLGIATIKTDNDTRNKPMLAINDKLGFVRQPAVLSLSRDFWGCQG